jgi:hypothetical protein
MSYGYETNDVEDLWQRDLDDIALDAAEREESRGSNGTFPQLPEGNYVTVPELSVKRFLSDYSSPPRRILSFFGSVVGADSTHRGKVRFSLSPDAGMNRAGTQKSLDYRLYVQARMVYKAAYQRSPTLDELENFVRDASLTVKLIKGRDRNLVVAIDRAGEQGESDDDIPF